MLKEITGGTLCLTQVPLPMAWRQMITSNRDWPSRFANGGLACTKSFATTATLTTKTGERLVVEGTELAGHDQPLHPGGAGH